MLESTDLDGIITKNNLNRADYKPYKMHQYYTRCSATGYAKRPWKYILSARKEYFRKLTEKWLEENNVEYQELLLLPNKQKKNFENIVKYKSNMINNLRIKRYFEDDIRIASKLNENCRNTQIILVKNVK